MRILLISLSMLFAGCSGDREPLAESPPPELRSAQSRAEVVTPPVTTIYVGFADEDMNFVVDNDWTNYWTVIPWISPDVTAPLDQWQYVTPAFEWRDAVLVVPVSFTNQQMFVRAEYQPK